MYEKILIIHTVMLTCHVEGLVVLSHDDISANDFGVVKEDWIHIGKHEGRDKVVVHSRNKRKSAT